MNTQKDKFEDWKRVYSPKEFFALIFVMFLFICPVYQIYHDFIAKDSKIVISGYVIDTNQMKINGEYKYTISVVDKEKKYLPFEKSVDAREYFTTKIGDASTFIVDNKNVNQIMISIAYVEYVIIASILLFVLIVLVVKYYDI